MSTVEWLEIIFGGGNLNEKTFIVAKEIERKQHEKTWKAAVESIHNQREFHDYYENKFREESNF